MAFLTGRAALAATLCACGGNAATELRVVVRRGDTQVEVHGYADPWGSRFDPGTLVVFQDDMGGPGTWEVELDLHLDPPPEHQGWAATATHFDNAGVRTIKVTAVEGQVTVTDPTAPAGQFSWVFQGAPLAPMQGSFGPTTPARDQTPARDADPVDHQPWPIEPAPVTGCSCEDPGQNPEADLSPPSGGCEGDAFDDAATPGTGCAGDSFEGRHAAVCVPGRAWSFPWLLLAAGPWLRGRLCRRPRGLPRSGAGG